MDKPEEIYFKISKSLGDAIAQYLQTKPYQEVFQLIAAISQLTVLEEKGEKVNDVD